MPQTATSVFTQGAVVRFTRGPLGTLADPNDSHFAEHKVNKGEQGLYQGPHPYKDLGDKDWHLVSVAHEGRMLHVPVHSAQIEPA